MVGDTFDTFSVEEAQRVWNKAIGRLDHDPDGAITAARSLVESVCKHILDATGELYDRSSDLKNLYGKTVKSIRLAPDQQSEQHLRDVLGSCSTIVDRLYYIRNEYGDAHGKGPNAIVPSPRHAELAVNVAGILAVFLVRTKLEQDSESVSSL